MEIFWKAAAGILIASILRLTIEKKEYGALVSLAACIITTMLAMKYVEPVADFIHDLENVSSLGTDALDILMRSLGVCLVSDFCGTLCLDTGNSSLEKCIHIIGNCAILWLALPIFQSFLDLIQYILTDI